MAPRPPRRRPFSHQACTHEGWYDASRNVPPCARCADNLMKGSGETLRPAVEHGPRDSGAGSEMPAWLADFVRHSLKVGAHITPSVEALAGGVSSDIFHVSW